MKKYLLDTHILLWWLNDDRLLPKSAKEVLQNPQNIIFFSSVNIWEIIIKATAKKLTVHGDIKNALDNSNFIELSITAEHLFFLEQLPAIHQDPFDRMLIAQESAEELTLITSDKLIKQYDVYCL